jgi:glycosyltransferase involved in cell wall biosynthesis
MRIAIFSEVFLPKIDGITNRLRHTIDRLLDDGHEVRVFGPLHAQNRYRGVKVVQIAGMPLPLYPGLQITHPDPRIAWELFKFRPDVVHAVGPASLGVLGSIAARALGLPLVASYHTDLPAYLPRYGLGFAQPAIWPVIRAVHGLAHVNLCPSTVTRDELEGHGIKPVGIWRGGVDTERFRPEAASATMRLRLTEEVRPDAVKALAVYVGRVGAEKGLDRFFDLHDAIPGLHVAIVGDGPDRERLEKKARGKRFVFTGFLRGDDLAAAYASADLFFMPSTTETLGFVVLEAMSSGTPVVAARAGGQLDLVSDGENGLLYAPEDPSDAIRQVQTLIANPSQRRHLGIQARKAAEGGTWEEETGRLLSHYETAIDLASRGQQALHFEAAR